MCGVHVRDGDWYGARSECFIHAASNGYSTVGILVGGTQLFRRACHAPLRPATDEDQHGMWVYLDRLAKRYGHVYVPPVGWHRAGHSQCGTINSPTVPMVAAYRVSAALDCRDSNGPLGLALCNNGYDSYTVGEYFYHNPGPVVLDEAGSATTWNRAYERAINRLT